MEVKDFKIIVGKPGAYDSGDKSYGKPFGVYAKYGILVKHVPYPICGKQKGIISQDWPDEQGEDVFLPKNADGTPAVVHESSTLDVQFVYHAKSNNGIYPNTANRAIGNLISDIQGRWLKIFDEYTGIGYDGVYLANSEEDPKFKRRMYDTVVFTLTFKINGNRITDASKFQSTGGSIGGGLPPISGK